jgi:DNA-directed RNA polymerase specialized sigma24 family protein
MEKQTLTGRLSRSSLEAFSELLDVYVPLVSRTSYRIMCDRADSEFITVSVMLSMWNDRMSFRDDMPLMQELLRRTCRACRRRLFRRRILMLMSIDPDVFVAASPVVPSYDEYIARQAWQIYCRASADFSDRQRFAYTLCELGGLSLASAAEGRGFRVSNLHAALAEARAAVKEGLAMYGKIGDYEAYVGFLRRVKDQLTDKVGLKRRIMGFVSVTE